MAGTTGGLAYLDSVQRVPRYHQTYSSYPSGQQVRDRSRLGPCRLLCRLVSSSHYSPALNLSFFVVTEARIKGEIDLFEITLLALKTLI